MRVEPGEIAGKRYELQLMLMQSEDSKTVMRDEINLLQVGPLWTRSSRSR